MPHAAGECGWGVAWGWGLWGLRVRCGALVGWSLGGVRGWPVWGLWGLGGVRGGRAGRRRGRMGISIWLLRRLWLAKKERNTKGVTYVFICFFGIFFKLENRQNRVFGQIQYEIRIPR